MNMDIDEKTLQETMLYKGRIISLYCDDVLLPNGDTAKREYVTHRGGAAILPVDEEGNVYLVRQFRYPYREEILEIPAGKLEEGEEFYSTAVRELEEETGMKAGKMTSLGILYPSPGYTNEHLYVYLATELGKGRIHLDEDEFVNTVKMPYREAYEMVMDNRIKDAKTCYAILRYAQMIH